MLDFPRWKIWGVFAVMAFALLFAGPTFFPEKTVASWPGFVPKAQLNLGLDLRGGSHLLLEAETADVRKQQLDTLEDSVKSELRDADGGRIGYGDLSTAGGKLSFLVRNVTDLDRTVEAMRGISKPIGVTGQRDIDVAVVDGNRIQMTPTPAGLVDASDRAMEQAVEVIRRRVDAVGTREPTIIRQGDNRIVVQVPGLQDPTGLKALIGKTAKLEFKLVDLGADPAEVAKGRAPVGSQILGNVGGGATVVKRRAIITGDQLTDARQDFDQNGQAVVSFKFNSVGAKRFARVTQENVGKPFAIIIDNQVISAPNINEPILGGAGQISGNYTVESAGVFAIQLRSGALPVKLTVIEERTVGPDLGADSIRSGAIASTVAVVAVAFFMLITYGRFGVYSIIALFFNVMLILAIMSLTGATLTLPGIAGLVLTIGAAVDANVLINERIREELRKGRAVVHSIETGYREASRTIFDANFCNVIAAVVMISFGSGPVKGFGVVLTIGIVTSVFTAVTFTRMVAADWLRRDRPTALVL